MSKKKLFRMIPLIVLPYCLVCTFKNPELPSFESKFTIPITSKSYLMADLAEQHDNLYADKNSFGFTVQGTLDTVFVGENLKRDEPMIDSGTFLLGVFSLNYTDTLVDSSLSIAALWPPAAKNIGQEIPVLPFEFDLTLAEFNKTLPQQFESIKIDSGMIFIQIENNLGVPLENPVAVTFGILRDNAPIEIGATSIHPAETAHFDLTGDEITRNFYLKLQGRSPGSGIRPIKIDSLSQKIILRFGFLSLRARSAVGQIPPLPLKQADWLYLTDESDQISMVESRFQQAELILDVFSYLNLNSHFILSSEHLFDPGNSPLALPIDLPKGATLRITQSLDSWRLAADISEGVNRPKLKIATTGSTDATGTEQVAVSARDSIVVKAQIVNAKMDFVRGSVNRLLVEMEPTREQLELDYELPKLKFKNTELQLRIFNRIAFPIELNLSFTGERNAQPLERYEFRRRIIEPAIAVAGQEQATETLTTFSVVDERFNNLLNVIPEYISVTGSALVGDWDVMGQVNRSDYIYGSFAFFAPFHVAFEDTVLNLDTTFIRINPKDWREPQSSGVDHELSADLSEEIIDGQFMALVENHLPVAAAVILKIDSSAAHLFSGQNFLIEKRLYLRAGETSETGMVTRAVRDTLQFYLSPAELEYFKNATQQPKNLVILTQFNLAGTKGEYVKILPDDYLAIKESYFIFRYRYEPK